MDAETIIIIKANTSVSSILGQRATEEFSLYDLTPLDFVNPSNGLSLLRLFWAGFMYPLFQRGPKARPVETFPNTKATPPRGMSAAELAVGAFIGLGYTGIHLIGWNFHFPTSIELLFWRISSAVIVGLVSVYLCALAAITFCSAWIGRNVLGVQVDTPDDLKKAVPELVMGTVTGIPTFMYTLARFYIIVEAFSSLRALPLGVYKTVDWNNFLPHI